MNTLPQRQQIKWKELSAIPSDYVLYGGTAIALQLGHRESVDFDFFSNEKLNLNTLYKSLPFLEKDQIIIQEQNYLTVISDEVKISFFNELKFGRTGNFILTNNNIKIASLVDLLGTKLKTILQRAEGKDYQDIVALFKCNIDLKEGLGTALSLFENQFPVSEVLKALNYTEDIHENWRINLEDKKLISKKIQNLTTHIIPSKILSNRIDQ